jgi:peptidoglycan/LPS O-acetylase OafA/YrhL
MVLLGGSPKLNPPLWSLEIEIQFYILAPILVLAFLRLPRFSAMPLGILTLIALSILASHLQFGDVLPLIQFFHLFLAGILVNVLIFGGLVPQRVPRAVWDIVFIVSLVVLYVLGKCHASMLSDAAQVACYLALFLAAFEGMFFKRFLTRPWIFTIGGMCYTIYLIHLPILQVLTGIVMRTSGFVSFVPGVLISAVVTLPILSVVSVAFFLLIEKPCMNRNWPLRVGNWIAGLELTPLSRTRNGLRKDVLPK